MHLKVFMKSLLITGFSRIDLLPEPYSHFFRFIESFCPRPLPAISSSSSSCQHLLGNPRFLLSERLKSKTARPTVFLHPPNVTISQQLFCSQSYKANLASTIASGAGFSRDHTCLQALVGDLALRAFQIKPLNRTQLLTRC